MKHLSLRLKITLLCVSVMICLAASLTIGSIFNVDQLFVKKLPDQIPFTKIVELAPQSEIASPEPIKPNESTATSHFSISDDQDSNIADSAIPAVKTVQATLVAVTAKTRNDFAIVSLIIMGIVMVLGTILIYTILGKSLKPIKQLSLAMNDINENTLSMPIACHTSSSEVSQLASAFESMTRKLDQAFQTQKYFTSAAAHELKTPLACMQASIEVLEMDDSPTVDEYAHVIDVMQRNTTRLIDLTENLLSMNRQQNEDMNQVVSLNMIVQEVLSDLNPRINEKEITVKTSCSGAVTGNILLLSRAVYNLTENAIKYSQQNSEIRIYTDHTDTSLTLSVADNGPGIPNDEKSQIFEPFYRIDNSRSRKIAGSGLGLSLVKLIADKHSAKLSVTDNQLHGSIFSILFDISE